MPKGLFPQSCAILLDGPLSARQLLNTLAGYEPELHHDRGKRDWMGGFRAVRVPFRPRDNGHFLVEAFDVPWPDDMGDAKKRVELFGAWGMGQFGDYTYPGGLERASEMAGRFAWKEAPAQVKRHKAFLRIKSCYVLGAGDDAPVRPKKYDAAAEVAFMLRLVDTLLARREALAYFNPNGEVLMGRELLAEHVAHGDDNGHPAVAALAMVRMIEPEEAPGWTLMDTIGMEQLGVRDLEACFEQGEFDPGEVFNFLRNLSLYLLDKGPVVKHRDHSRGPGDVRWRAFHASEALVPAPRPTLRWFPDLDIDYPEALFQHTED